MDAALQHVITNAVAVHFCEGEPVTYAEATTNLGTGSGRSVGRYIKTTDFNFTAIENDPTSGRRTRVPAGTGSENAPVASSANGTTWWVVVSGTEILAKNTLASGVSVVSGSPIQVLSDINIRFPDTV